MLAQEQAHGANGFLFPQAWRRGSILHPYHDFAGDYDDTAMKEDPATAN